MLNSIRCDIPAPGKIITKNAVRFCVDINNSAIEFTSGFLPQILSLSLRWPWPENWVRYTSWTFVFNLDAWELAKFWSNTTYKSVQV